MADVGAPTLYNEVKLEMARDYVDNQVWKTDGDVFPTIEGLALYLNVSRDTIYEWASQVGRKEFSDIVNKLRNQKSKVLQNKGAVGDFNAKIAGLLLGHEGYREKIDQDITSKGEALGVVVLPAKEE